MVGCWRSLYGQIALEVFGHFAPLFSDQEPMFELLMQELVRGMGLEGPDSLQGASAVVVRSGDGPSTAGIREHLHEVPGEFPHQLRPDPARPVPPSGSTRPAPGPCPVAGVATVRAGGASRASSRSRL